MKTIRACIVLTFAFSAAIAYSTPLRAQVAASVRDQLRIVDSTMIQVITLRDGSSLVGRIMSINDDSVDFQMGIGRVPVAIRDIREVKESDSDRMPCIARYGELRSSCFRR